MQCGYNFKNNYFNSEVTWGHFVGKCKCGSEIDCKVERNEDIMSINCSTTKGTKECGKRYIRGTARENFGKQLQTKSAHVIRADLADELMNYGDCEPSHLPKASTLREIKHQATVANFLDVDLMKSLEILSVYDMEGEIPWIGYKPFFIHYSTKHQRTVYCTTSDKEHARIEIDASGSIIQPITRIDKKKSGPIFLYIAVLCTRSGQTSVAQMLTERHSTGAIHFWLSQWTEHWGLTPPKEIVCDMSKPLLAGAVRAYTSSKTINEYADEFLNDGLPSCYIRVDIAHFIKMWVNILTGERHQVAKFYKACIGKIVLCRNIQDAQKIIQATLTIARSENCGMTNAGSLSACEREKLYMRQVLTTDDLHDLNLEEYENWEVDEQRQTEAEPINNAEPSLWRDWGKNIDIAAKNKIESCEGTEINPHWLPRFADRLVEELKWLPLWSCIARDRYGYGRCPASSAHVEAEFKTIKNEVLKDATLPLRADDFIRRHKKFVDGISKIINAKPQISIDDLEEDSGSHISIDDLEAARCTSEFPSCETRTDISHQCPACQNGDLPGGAHRCMVIRRQNEMNYELLLRIIYI